MQTLKVVYRECSIAREPKNDTRVGLVWQTANGQQIAKLSPLSTTWDVCDFNWNNFTDITWYVVLTLINISFIESESSNSNRGSHLDLLD